VERGFTVYSGKEVQLPEATAPDKLSWVTPSMVTPREPSFDPYQSP
jgi:hypothetical protein